MIILLGEEGVFNSLKALAMEGKDVGSDDLPDRRVSQAAIVKLRQYGQTRLMKTKIPSFQPSAFGAQGH
jgi:hypothetical protein